MPLAKTLPTAILETILARLAALFLSGAGGDLTAARQAAVHMLAAYHPETAEELRLAAQVVSFSFHALEALGQAADPNLSLARILRLRGSTVSLNRQSDKAQHRLEQLQQARQATPAQPEQPHSEPRQPEPPITFSAAQDTPAASQPAAPIWTAFDQHHQDIRIAASIKRAEARVAAMSDTPPTSVIANIHASQPAPA